MYNFASISDLPKVGETLHLSTSMSGHTYDLLAVNPSQFSLLFNGKHKFFIDFPVFVRGKHKEEVCNLVLDYSKWNATWKWIPRPEAYKCPLRRWLAENYIRQQTIEFAEEYTVSRSWSKTEFENSVADLRIGEDHHESGDWSRGEITEESEDEYSEGYTARYIGGTAAIVVRIKDRDVCYRRNEEIERIVINPSRKKEGIEWVLNRLKNGI